MKSLKNKRSLNRESLLSIFIVLFIQMNLNAANLLFKSNFGKGVTLSAPYGFYVNSVGGGGSWQDITGIDSETGFDWSKKVLGATFMGLQNLTIDVVDSTTIGDHVQNEIRQVVGPNGSLVNELFLNLKKKADAGAVPTGVALAQIPLMIKRPWDIGDVKDFYLSYWFKHQADLESQLDNTISSGNWRVQFGFKTGGYENTYAGDYRITTIILKDTKDGKLYWSTKGDNVANGPWPRVDYWRVDNKAVAVPVDKWFKFEVYWHRSSGADGRYWAAVDGQVIVDRLGPNMGDLNLPINRIFPITSYSGGWPTVESQMTALEIWDGFPCGDGISCFKSLDTIPPLVSISGPSSGTEVSGIFTIDANATDNVSVAKVNLFIDGVYSATDVTAPYSFTVDSKKMSNGTHTFVAKAFDSSGLFSISSPISINVNNPVADLSAPVVNFISPANGDTVSGSVLISTLASDDSGVAGIKQSLYIDGALVTTATGATLNYTWNVKNRGKGAKSKATITITAVDASGKSSSKSIIVYKF